MKVKNLFKEKKNKNVQMNLLNLEQRDWQTSINIRMRKMHIVQPLLMKSENIMLLSRVQLLFINQLWYKQSVIIACKQALCMGSSLLNS